MRVSLYKISQALSVPRPSPTGAPYFIFDTDGPVYDPPLFPVEKLKELHNWNTGGYNPGVVEAEHAMGGYGPFTMTRPVKAMALEGFVTRPTAAELEQFFSNIVALPPTPYLMIVEDAVGERQMVVWVNGQVEIERLRERAGRILLPLAAPDPRKYSTEVTTVFLDLDGGTTTLSFPIENFGNAPSEPTIRLVGTSIAAGRLPILIESISGTTVNSQYGFWALGDIEHNSTTSNLWLTPDFGGQKYSINANVGGVTIDGTWPSVAGGRINMRITCGASGATTTNVYVDFREAWF